MKMRMNDNPGIPAAAAFAELNRVLHELASLNIMALFYMLESADFIFVMNQTGLTWRNLSSHLSKLEEAGYLEIEKSYKGQRPNTMIRLTPARRESFKY